MKQITGKLVVATILTIVAVKVIFEDTPPGPQVWTLLLVLSVGVVSAVSRGIRKLTEARSPDQSGGGA